MRTVSGILSRGGKLSGSSDLRPLCRGTLYVANAKKVSKLTSCRPALCTKSEITVGSTVVAPISVTIFKRTWRTTLSEKLNIKPNNRKPSNMAREWGSVQSIEMQKSCSRPLNFATTQPPNLSHSYTVEINRVTFRPNTCLCLTQKFHSYTLMAISATCP
jgi:hypothetical protein